MIDDKNPTPDETETEEGTQAPSTPAADGEGTQQRVPLDEQADDESARPEAEAGEGDQPDTFPRSYVEQLRQENGKYRQRAQRADELARRLHRVLVEQTGRLADPSDLAFDEAHLDDPEALTAAVDALLASKPHLASRKVIGDVGQGASGASGEVNLLGILRGDR